MQIASYFQPNRFLNLLKKDSLFDHKRTWLVGGVMVAIGLITVIAWAWDRENDVITFHSDFFGVFLLISGFLYTASAFKELEVADTAHLYLSLPASNLEKFLSKFLTTTIGFTVAFTILYWIFSLIANGIAGGYFDYPMDPFRPFSEQNGLLFKLYFVIQPVFLLGAIVYRKYAAFKTILTCFILALIIGIIGYFLFRTVFFDFFEGWKITNASNEVRPAEGFMEFVTGPLTKIGKFLFWIVLPVFLWVVTYFKLTEKEI